MRSQVVVLTPPLFDQDLCLLERVEGLAVQEFVAQLAVERFDVAVLPGRAWFDEQGRDPRSASQLRTAVATNSGPLSLLMCSGMPCSGKRSESANSTSWLVKRRARATIAAVSDNLR